MARVVVRWRFSRVVQMLGWFAVVGTCALGMTACSSSVHEVGVNATGASMSVRVKDQRMLLVPDLEVGAAGWCTLVIGHGYTCNAGRIVVPIFEQGWSASGPPQLTEGIALTTSEVIAVSIDGAKRIPTWSEPGLPDGLRAVAVELPGYRPQDDDHRFRRPQFTPFNRRGQRIRRRVTQVHLAAFGIQTTIMPEPAHAKVGACRIEELLVPGLVATRSVMISRVEPKKELLRGAMLPCASTVFESAGSSAVATILLDAGNPGSEPGTLPAAQPLRGHAGIVREPSAEGEIFARRSPGAWLVASKCNQRLCISLLGDLHVSLHFKGQS
jgi:hypothetical protein